MFDKLIYVIILYLYIIINANIITLWSYAIGKNKRGGDITKKNNYWILNIFYQKLLKTPIYYSGTYTPTDKVDIIISNHIHSIDFMIQFSICRKIDKRPLYFILQKQFVFYPGIGFAMCSAPDIKLNKKIEDDMDNLVRSIRKIKNGIIVIMPEGTRFTPEKKKLAQKYSKDNNLPIFNNTLYPKMKGLWLIYTILTNENRMGNIIDMTIMLENCKNQKTYAKQMLTKKLGNTLCVINNYTPPPYEIIKEYDMFKIWFLDIWKNKDNILENMYTINDTNIYTRLYCNVTTKEISSAVFVISMFTYLMIKTKGRYLGYSLIISYIITFIRYKLLKKKL
jgi:1-acyl-sn-glycerol-3-phosphate acyltransferase